MAAHPAADLFPLIEGREFDELVEDIRKFGLRTPILVDSEGLVLDGRNRLRACRKAGVEPRFETWNGRGSAADLVVSMNLHRRHLNESQRAVVAAKLLEMKDLRSPAANLQQGRSGDKAARLLNVSPRSVYHASKVLRRGDQKLIHAVESGEMSVSAAATVAAGGVKRSARRPAVRRDALLALWTPAEQQAETMKVIEEWGFEQCRAVGPTAEGDEAREVLLVATRRNPLAGGGGR